MYISKEEAQKLVRQEQAYLVDVRSREEFALNPVAGVLNYPLDELEKCATENLDSSRPVVLFCESGRRSNMGCKLLRFNGFSKTYNLGTYKSWLL